VAERFLDDDPCPPGLAAQAMLADRLDDGLVGGRRRREIEEPVGVRAEREVELVKGATQIFVTSVVRRRDEVQVLGEAAPDLFVQGLRPAVLRDRLVQLPAVLLVAQRLTRRADNGEGRREETLQSQVVERGNELSLGEVARAAEDDDGRGLGDP